MTTIGHDRNKLVRLTFHVLKTKQKLFLLYTVNGELMAGRQMSVSLQLPAVLKLFFPNLCKTYIFLQCQLCPCNEVVRISAILCYYVTTPSF